MSLLDDLENFVSNKGTLSEQHMALQRVRAALRLLDQPGARQWLEALPGLIELGRKATPGPWEFQDEVPGAGPAIATILGMSFKPIIVLHATDITFDKSMKRRADAQLVAALRNALADAEKEG